MGSGDGRAVISHYLQDQLDEFGGIVRQLPLEPEQADDTAYAHPILQDGRKPLSGIEHLVPAVVRYGADEGSGLPDVSCRQGLAVVCWYPGHLRLLELSHCPAGEQHLVDLSDLIPISIK